MQLQELGPAGKGPADKGLGGKGSLQVYTACCLELECSPITKFREYIPKGWPLILF